jgi:hypothetical protein
MPLLGTDKVDLKALEKQALERQAEEPDPRR